MHDSPRMDVTQWTGGGRFERYQFDLVLEYDECPLDIVVCYWETTIESEGSKRSYKVLCMAPGNNVTCIHTDPSYQTIILGRDFADYIPLTYPISKCARLKKP